MTIHITAAPQLTPLLDTIYLAGSINGWSENNGNFICVPSESGWTLDINGPENLTFEFKFTRGSWSTVEGDNLGNYIGNRTATLINNSTLQVEIAGWEDIAGIHTTTPEVRILDSNFLIPQLNRTRRIWIRLPEGYKNSNQSYPTVYVMDGQNTMDLATSFAGEWEIDEAINTFTQENCRNAIVVAIDNGESNRIDEYSPWVNNQYNEGGEGDAFAAFLAETLKPYIDQHFNTLPDASHTTIIGSSLGALIATYTMCKYPSAFGNGGMFSPAYWFNPAIVDYANTHPLNASSRIYFVCGTQESDDMVSDMQTMETTITNAITPAPLTQFVTHTDGAHSEWYWRREFPAAYEWLTQCATSQLVEKQPSSTFQIFPNPTSDSLRIHSALTYPFVVQIIDQVGKICSTQKGARETQLDLSRLSSGAYLVRIIDEQGQVIHQESIIKK
jgi:predicted alpha/beta superfamily hydrolase